MLKSPRPKEPHLLIEWVKYELRLKGITFSSLARQYGGARETITHTFSKRLPKWEKVIADAMEMMPCELWPERYPNESVTVPAGKSKSTRKGRAAQ